MQGAGHGQSALFERQGEDLKMSLAAGHHFFRQVGQVPKALALPRAVHSGTDSCRHTPPPMCKTARCGTVIVGCRWRTNGCQPKDTGNADLKMIPQPGARLPHRTPRDNDKLGSGMGSAGSTGAYGHGRVEEMGVVDPSCGGDFIQDDA